MSTKTPAQENDATYEELAEFSEATDVSETTAAPKKNSNVFYRIVAILLALAPVAVFYFLEAKVLAVNEGYTLQNYKLLDLFIKMFTEEGFAVSKLFGFIPLMSVDSSVLGIVNSAMLYLIPLSMVVCILAGLVAIFARKAAPTLTRMILFIEFGVYAGYALSILLPYAYYNLNVLETLDYVVLGAAAGALLLFFILSIVKSGKRSLLGLLIFLFTVASAGAVLYATCVQNAPIKALIVENLLYKWIILGVVGVYALFVLISLMGVAARKVHGADIVRCVFMLLMGAGVIVLSFLVEGFSAFLLYGIIAAATALVMLIVETIAISVRVSKEKKAAEETKEEEKEETAEEEEEEAEEETEPEVEEVAPVAPTPVLSEEPAPAPVVAAPVAVEEVAPTQAPAQETAPEVVPVAATPESDAYGSAFDAFIGMLTSEERMQFTHIFLLRSENKLPEIPEYKIGGDNKVFFRKIFVNLGSLRARIPDGLMEKIYQFSIRQ